MKISKLHFLIYLLLSVALFVGCSDDDDDEQEVSPFVNDYVISEAKTSEALQIITNEAGPQEIPANTDITAVIQAALLSAVECDSPTKSYIEMHEDGTLYLTCEGENPLNAGTWEELSPTSIRLSMNSAAIPSSPIGFVFTVTDIVMNNTSLMGETTVPLPKEMIAVMLAAASGGQLTLNMDETPVALPVTFALELMIK